VPSKKPKRRQIAAEIVGRRQFVRDFVENDASKKKPPRRMNFIWQTARLEKIWQAARRMDVSLEAFIRFAAYERAVKVLAEPDVQPIEYEREKEWIDHRYSEWGPAHRRLDLLPLNWRWRQHALDVVEQAARRSQCDSKTFIDVAAYDKAVEIAGPEPV